jgi:hypothetical protein
MRHDRYCLPKIEIAQIAGMRTPYADVSSAKSMPLQRARYWRANIGQCGLMRRSLPQTWASTGAIGATQENRGD